MERGHGRSVASVNIVMGAEDQFSISVGQEGDSLSGVLVQLKAGCMKFLGDFLIRQNTPLEEPDDVLEESLSNDEEEEDKSGAKLVSPKKRKR